MKISIGQTPLIFPLLILMVFGSISYEVYRSIRKLLTSMEWMEHTEEVIFKADNVRFQAKELQTASSTYAVTGNSSFMEEAYKESTLSENIGQLKSLTRDNPRQQSRVDSLAWYAQKNYYFSRLTIGLVNNKGLVAMTPALANQNALLYAGRMRTVIDSVRLEEKGLLKQRKQANDLSVKAFNRFSTGIFILMGMITLFLLIISNNYFFQNREKEKRAAELFIANKELAFQNDEKENRALELSSVNKELAFQNREKEKRAAELFIANKELAFQNDEKEKRAAELLVVNKDLTKAEDDIRKLNEDLEQKVIRRTLELETANKDLEAFSYSVSHDLRAPIRAINGYAQILEEDYSEKFDSEGVQTLHSIRYNSKKIGNLIDDLLAFSKLGRKHVSLSTINMQSLVGSIIEDLSVEEGANKPVFKNNTALPEAQGDPSLIKQVWINLISNAIKYSQYKTNPVIETGAYLKTGLVIYFVKDNGAGFDMQYYDKLFGVFQRLHSQEEFEGTGIGLAMVERIVHRHHGKVWAESNPGEPTCFYFSLPDIHF